MAPDLLVSGAGLILIALAASFVPSYLRFCNGAFADVYILISTISLLALLALCARYKQCHIALIIALLPLFPYYYRSWGQKWVHTADFALLALTAYLLLDNKPRPVATRTPTVLLSMTFWLASWAVLGLFGADSIVSFRGVIGLTPVLLVAVCLRASINLGRTPERLFTAMKLALAISCIFLILQLCFGIRFSFYTSLNPNVGGGTFTRYPGPMFDPQAFGQALCVLTLFCVQDVIHSRSLSSLVLAFFGVFSLVLTASRAPMIAFLVGLLLLIFLNKRSHLGLMLIVLTALIALSAIVSIMPSHTLGRILDTTADAEIRLNIWQRSLPIFRDSPLAGIGWDNYATVIAHYDPEAYWITAEGQQVFDQPESTYIKVLVETGLVGSAVFLALLIASLRRYINCLKSLSNYAPPTRQLLLSSFVALVALLISFSTVYTLEDHRLLILFALLLVMPYFFIPHATLSSQHFSRFVRITSQPPRDIGVPRSVCTSDHGTSHTTRPHAPAQPQAEPRGSFSCFHFLQRSTAA